MMKEKENETNASSTESTDQCFQASTLSFGVKELWRQWLRETTLHGGRNIAVTRKWKLTRYVWILLVSGMIVILGFILWELYDSYIRYSVITELNMVPKNYITMPAFTLCLASGTNMERLNKSSPQLYEYISKTRSFIPTRNYFDTDKDMEEFMNKSYTLLDNVTISEFVDTTRFKTEEIIQYLAINSQSIAPSDYHPFLTRYDDPYASCLVLNKNESGGGFQMSYYASVTMMIDAQSNKHPDSVFYEGITLFVHDNHEGHRYQVPRVLRPGSYVRIYFDRTENRHLPLPYTSFGDRGCMQVEKKGFVNPLKISVKYSYDACLEEAVIEHIIEKCGCVYPPYTKFYPQVSECTMKTYEICVMYMAAAFIETTLLSPDFAIECLPECTYGTYGIDMTMANFPSRGFVPFYEYLKIDLPLSQLRDRMIWVSIMPKDTRINVISHVPEVTLISVFANVGGYMGLFLGASLLTLTEFLETIILTVCLFIQRLGKMNRVL